MTFTEKLFDTCHKAETEFWNNPDTRLSECVNFTNVIMDFLKRVDEDYPMEYVKYCGRLEE